MFVNVISSPRGHLTLQQSLDLANIYLEHAGKVADPDIILVLCHDTEVSLLQAKKASKHADQSVRHGIASAYIELGNVLEKQGRSTEAKAIFKKVKKLGVKIQGQLQVAQSTDLQNDTASVKGSMASVDKPNSSVRKQKQINNTATIPPHIFAEDAHPTVALTKLPEPDERLTNTPQLACCLSLLNNAHGLDDILEPIARNWLQVVENDEDEHERLKILATDVIRTFKKEEIKDAKVVAEVVCLAPVIERDLFRDLLGSFVDGIDNSTLLDTHQLQGLARLIQGADTGYLDADDL
ncbi:hypothetical protein BGX34_008096, partial [Mortierella sp. NVP85]